MSKFANKVALEPVVPGALAQRLQNGWLRMEQAWPLRLQRMQTRLPPWSK
jgi:hypothetical protein